MPGTMKKRSNASAVPPLLSEQLRDILANAPVSRYAIAKATGIRQSTLSRFVNGQRDGMTLATIDALGKYLRLTITSAGPIDEGKE